MRTCAYLLYAFGFCQYAVAQLPQKPPLTTEQIAAQARTAVVLLKVYDSRGQQLGFGSGFIAQDRRVVTNSHVVEGADHVEVVDADGKLLLIAPHAEAVSTTFDIAILPAVSSAPTSLILAQTQPAVGAAVVAIGAPEGLANTVSTGIVSAIRRGNLIQISAPLSPGSSGGPVINASGEVIGISTAQLVEGQNLNFAVPASNIRAMLASPPGRLNFPAKTQSSATATTGSNGVSAASGSTGAAHQSMRQSIPTTPLATINDTEFSLAFYGCYGNESGGTVACVVDFSNPSSGDRVSVYRAGLFDAVGHSIAADGAVNSEKGYRIGDDQNWIPVQGGRTTRVFFRFQTTFTPNGVVRFGLQLGGPFIKRNQGFASTQIQVIRADEDEQRALFGFP